MFDHITEAHRTATAHKGSRFDRGYSVIMTGANGTISEVLGGLPRSWAERAASMINAKGDGREQRAEWNRIGTIIEASVIPII